MRANANRLRSDPKNYSRRRGVQNDGERIDEALVINDHQRSRGRLQKGAQHQVCKSAVHAGDLTSYHYSIGCAELTLHFLDHLPDVSADGSPFVERGLADRF